MAGDWMKVELHMPDKPEVAGIAAELDLDPDAVVGKLVRVWAWFDEHTEDGHAPSVTKMVLDRVAGVTGFARAMMMVGWLHEDGNYIQMPKFDRHNGKSAKNRALTLERKRRTRANGHDSVPETSRSQRDRSVTREESIEKRENNPPVVPPDDAGEGEPEPPAKSKGKTTNGTDYPPWFEDLWNQRPQRAGNDPKPKALEAVRARIRENEITPEQAMAKVIQYRQFCEATGKVGTETVMQLASFFGPKQQGYKQPWTPPRPGGRQQMAATGLANKDYGETDPGILGED